MSAPNSLFVRAAKAQPTERTPVWFMRQAGRYMPEYRAIRKKYSLIEICKKPEIAAQVTIEAAEILKVDAAIIFADLLLPLEVMGLPFHFAAGEGPKIEKPIRTSQDVAALRTDRAADLGYVSEAVTIVCKHFGDKLPVIGFCGAPFTLASYMIEGGMPERRRLSPLRSAPRDGTREAPAKNRSAHHLFWHRQRYPFARDERSRRGSDRLGLAHPARRRLAEPELQRLRAGQSRSRSAICGLEAAEGAC